MSPHLSRLTAPLDETKRPELLLPRKLQRQGHMISQPLIVPLILTSSLILISSLKWR